MVGIRIEGCSSIEIINCGFEGLDIGIDASDSADLLIDGARFNNVKTPVKGRRITRLVARNNIDHSAHHKPARLTPTANAVRLYISTLRNR